MIQPCRSRASARSSTMRSPTSPTVPDTNSSSGGAQIGAPPDPRRRPGTPETSSPRRASPPRPRTTRCPQLPAGGDQHRFADVVERDPVPRRQRLDRGDAGDDVVGEVDPRGAPRRGCAACCRTATGHPRPGRRRRRRDRVRSRSPSPTPAPGPRASRRPPAGSRRLLARGGSASSTNR